MNRLVFLCLAALAALTCVLAGSYYSPYAAAYRPYGAAAVRSYFYGGAVAPYASPYAAPYATPYAAPYAAPLAPDYYTYAAATALGYPYGLPYLGAYSLLKK